MNYDEHMAKLTDFRGSKFASLTNNDSFLNNRKNPKKNNRSPNDSSYISMPKNLIKN